MNTERRKRLQTLAKEIRSVHDRVAEFDMEAMVNDADEIGTEERDYHDNMPENMQNGEKGERADASANLMEEAKDLLEEFKDAVDKLSEAADKVEEASE